MKNIVVNRGSCKAGRATLRALVQSGYEVLNVDLLATARRTQHRSKPSP